MYRNNSQKRDDKRCVVASEGHVTHSVRQTNIIPARANIRVIEGGMDVRATSEL